MRVGAVLFDMDGTLVDSDAAVERAWTTWAGEYGVDVHDLLAIVHGVPPQPSIRRVRPDLDEPAVAAAAQRQLELQYGDLADVTALPGAHELLDFLDTAGLPWAVVTSADGRLAQARLGAAGIHARLLVTTESIERGKPYPDGYLLAARQLGVDPGDCLVVEDAQPGVDAGRAAGMRVVALKGLRGDLPPASLRELRDYLAA